jgi:hypothetical protein
LLPDALDLIIDSDNSCMSASCCYCKQTHSKNKVNT